MSQLSHFSNPFLMSLLFIAQPTLNQMLTLISMLVGSGTQAKSLLGFSTPMHQPTNHFLTTASVYRKHESTKKRE
jgi:hypothetical protein